MVVWVIFRFFKLLSDIARLLHPKSLSITNVFLSSVHLSNFWLSFQPSIILPIISIYLYIISYMCVLHIYIHHFVRLYVCSRLYFLIENEWEHRKAHIYVWLLAIKVERSSREKKRLLLLTEEITLLLAKARSTTSISVNALFKELSLCLYCVCCITIYFFIPKKGGLCCEHYVPLPCMV